MIVLGTYGWQYKTGNHNVRGPLLVVFTLWLALCVAKVTLEVGVELLCQSMPWNIGTLDCTNLARSQDLLGTCAIPIMSAVHSPSYLVHE